MSLRGLTTAVPVAMTTAPTVFLRMNHFDGNIVVKTGSLRQCRRDDGAFKSLHRAAAVFPAAGRGC